MDTDSAIYLEKPDCYNPPLSDYLGGLKDEMPDDTILEYVGLGPKNYGLRTAGGRAVCRVRGFNLNYRASRLINFDTLKRLATSGVDGRVERCQVLEPEAIVRQGLGDIRTAPKEKRYGMVFDKRAILPDGCRTVPFGWREPD